jgi:alpha-glucosidase
MSTHAINPGEMEWWKRGVIYEIYVRSFQDSNGDGIGDLAGIESRIDYLHWLGVTVIWLTPIYPSPQVDCGYDVADYLGVDRIHGSLQEFDRLLAALHDKGIRLVMDLVPNHTSAQHPWFKEACCSRESDKRAWYLWQNPGPHGQPPNNWQSTFGGSMWQWHQETEQFYLRTYLPEQPDLNWQHPEVRQAIFNAMRFWLARGVDGFRIDAMTHLIKDAQLRDDPPNPDYRLGMTEAHKQQAIWSKNQPEVHEILAEMRKVTDEYSDRLLMGEDYLSLGEMISYYGRTKPGVNFPFNFQLLEADWTAEHLRNLIDQYFAKLGQRDWPNWVLSNHDRARVATRIGGDRARGAALLLFTLRGTPTIYYGDELGMQDVPIPLEQRQDKRGLRQPGYGLGRDRCRTPMRWNSDEYAGFSTHEPWLPIGDGYQEQNVMELAKDSGSMLNLYRRLIEIRNSSRALLDGEYLPLRSTHGTLAYLRTDGHDCYLIAVNIESEAVECELEMAPVMATQFALRGELVLSTTMNRDSSRCDHRIPLAAHEGVIVRLAAP